MFTVKVKTLSGTNESFSVDDNITVLEFKKHIEGKVEILAGNQKLIFTGKVLANDKKLKEYNVEDKVVHVVKSSVPPTTRVSSTPSTTGASNSAPQTSRSSVSIGSFPSDFAANMMNMMGGTDNRQDIVIDMRRSQANPSQAHTESGRRIVLVRQWIRDANTLLDRVRDARQGTRLSSNTQTQEAREASLNSTGMQGEMLFAIGGDSSLFGNPLANQLAGNTASGQSSRPNRTANQPNQPSSLSQSSPAARVPGHSAQPRSGQSLQTNAASTQRAQTNTTPSAAATASDATPVVPPVNPDVEVLSAIWREIDALQQRLQPVMMKYKQIINRSTQARCQHNQHIFEVVHSVLHCMSHIYHAISDITADVNHQGVIELQAMAAAPPPPTAIIQQTIPVTIPLRATLNVGSPELRRRNQQANGSSTTTTTSVAAPHPNGGFNASSVVTQVEMDIDESLSEGGTAANTATGGSPFNLTNIIQDALSNAGFRLPTPGNLSTGNSNAAAGMPIGVAAPSTSGSQSIPTLNLPPNLAGSARSPGPTRASGAAGAARASGAGAAGAPRPAGASAGPASLFPGLPPGLSFPGVSDMAPPVQRDRNDPYLSSCHSRFWCRSPTLPGARTSSSTTQTQTDISTASSSSSTNTPNPLPTSSAPQATPSTSTPPTQVTSTRHGATTQTAAQITTKAATQTSVTGAYQQARGRPATHSERVNQMRGEGLLLNLCLSLSEAMQSQQGAESSDGFAPLMRTLNEESLEFTRSGTRPRRSIHDYFNLLDEQLARPTGRFPDLGLFHTLVSMIARELAVPELLLIFQNMGRPLNRLRLPLRTFIRSDVLQDGAPTNENIGDAIDRLMIPIAGFLQQVLNTGPSSPRVDTFSSLRSLVREHLYDLAHFVANTKSDTPDFGQNLLRRLERVADTYLALLRHAFGGETADGGIIEHIENMMARICAPLQTPLRDWLVNIVKDFVRVKLADLTSDRVPMSAISPHIQYLEAPPTTRSNEKSAADFVSSADEYQDAEMDVGATGSPVSNSSMTSLASEWRNIVPADWVSIIEEDMKKQLAQQSLEDPPYSDAYMAGRPNKRRKMGEEEDIDDDFE